MRKSHDESPISRIIIQDIQSLDLNIILMTIKRIRRNKIKNKINKMATMMTTQEKSLFTTRTTIIAA